MVERPADEFSATARSIGDQFLPRHLGVDFGVSRQPARNVYQLKGEPSGCRKCAKAASRGVFERQLADLMRGTGRFNLAQGLVALSTGLGAAASNVCAGFVVQVFGYTTGFFTLAAIAIGGLAFFASFMPETKPHEEMGSTSTQGDTPIPKPSLSES